MTWGEFKKLVDKQLGDTDLLDFVSVIFTEDMELRIFRFEETADEEGPGYVHAAIRD